MNDQKLRLEARDDREIVITRTLDAPPQLVFEACLRQWWGCDGSTLTVCEMNFRGGQGRFVMRMPDGSEPPLKGVYRDIAPPRRLAYTEWYDMPAIGSPQWLTTVTLVGDCKTKLTHTLVHASGEARNGHLQAGMDVGMAQSLDRLAAHLVSETASLAHEEVWP